MKGEYTDANGQSWIQRTEYLPGPGALQRPGSFKRMREGIWGNECRKTIRKVYGMCCDLGKEDEVWFYGFSRGAYIVRAVAGMLHWVGVRTDLNSSDGVWDEVLEIYANARKENVPRGNVGERQILSLVRC